jgi:hypothetical protein
MAGACRLAVDPHVIRVASGLRQRTRLEQARGAQEAIEAY